MIYLFYGAAQRYADITDEVFELCSDGSRLFIPKDDSLRATMFPDPAYGVVKNIVVIREDSDGRRTCFLYDAEAAVDLTLTPQEKEVQQAAIVSTPPARLPGDLHSVSDKLQFLHSHLKFAGGSWHKELTEQKLILEYLDPRATVLEIGANIGRSTLTIASVLKDARNLVSLECDADSVEILRNNRYANGFEFHIEASAISYRQLIQQEWNTIPSDELLPGYHWVPTITLEELTEKYPLEFDTLVADCEGALYYILQDNRELLRNIETVILEADFLSVDHKKSVEAIFQEFGLVRIHAEPLTVDWQHPFPEECANSFYEVWQRRTAGESIGREYEPAGRAQPQ